ncbi:MAG: hypothetical protein OXN17_16745 [Candidatus Poribacteria bacterium]|nr:hypothetical protein [Candidatus Poribacteria bacterium]MDE0505743.1 hypothetical protein [Candidatus Poribacteria bacterium]
MSIKESRLVNKMWKAQHLILYKLGLRDYRRAHRPIIKNCLLEVFKTTPHPTVIETGCIRDANEGTESTLTIASTLNERGAFYTFEICKEHIHICRTVCRDYNEHINYVEGDSIENLRNMIDTNVLDSIHLALFDSVNDGDHIWKEFKNCEAAFRSNSIVIIDDVLWGDKGRVIKPYLEASPEWRTRIYNVEYGMLVAQKIGG